MVATTETPDAYTRQLDVLHRLIAARVGRHELFFEIDMDTLPDGSPEIVGHALDADGQAYYFAMGWDAEAEAPTLRTWTPVAHEPHWWEAWEYRDARRLLGLDTPGAVELLRAPWRRRRRRAETRGATVRSAIRTLASWLLRAASRRWHR